LDILQRGLNEIDEALMGGRKDSSKRTSGHKPETELPANKKPSPRRKNNLIVIDL
jgi:hypothetical protein